MNQDFTNNYIDIIIEYIEKTSTSAFIKSHPDSAFIVHSGFKTISHVFMIHFINTNDSEGAFYNSQKAYMLYLEYLEQTSMIHDLNHADAILFVYSKTISDFTVVNNAKITDDTTIKTMETILWFENVNVNRTQITKRLIVELLRHDDISKYIDIAHKRDMTNDEYVVFLDETTALFKRSKWNDVSLYILQHWDKHVNMKIKPWCKWLKSPVM